MVPNAVQNATLNTFEIGTEFPRVPLEMIPPELNMDWLVPRTGLVLITVTPSFFLLSLRYKQIKCALCLISNHYNLLLMNL